MRRIFLTLLCVSALLAFMAPADAAKKAKGAKKAKTEQADTVKKESAYDKLFKDKKVRTAKGFMTLHLLDGKDMIAELPKNLIGRDILITSAVENTSDGGAAVTGYISDKTIHLAFFATDSLVLLKEVDSYRYSSTESLADEAVKEAHSGAILATFPIKAFSPDSSAYVFDITSYLSKYDSRLDPVDPLGANSFGGLIRTRLNHKSSLSMPYDVLSAGDDIALLSYETYTISQALQGMSVAGDDNYMTVLQRKSIILLPEKPARQRLADSRIGVNAVSKISFGSDDRGSRRQWYAQRWDLSGDRKVIFHVDTLFTPEFYNAISKGILKWNEAFEEMGKGSVIEVRPYPSPAENPAFDANSIRYSCVKLETISSDHLRARTWTDPRSGEIISASISIPADIFHFIHVDMLAAIGHVDASLRTVKHNAPILYDGLEAVVTNAVGQCLGLAPNYVASTVVPADSLRSPSYTSKYGLSASVMDDVPYNYFAKPGDKERGVCLVHKTLGAYDKYAVNWLYCDIEGAETPQDEVPYLNELIAASKHDPHCFYVRKPGWGDYRRLMDPRTLTDDLGDDWKRAQTEKIDALKQVMAGFDSWVVREDLDYTFMPYMNEKIIYHAAFPVLRLMGNVGGIYINEKRADDSCPSYEVVEKSRQREALKMTLDIMSDLSWLDDSRAWRDIFFVRSFDDYMTALLVDEFIAVFPALSFAEQKSADAYTLMEAYDDILDHVLADVKAGRHSAIDNILLQYIVIAYTMQESNLTVQSRRGVAAADAIAAADADDTAFAGFVPVPALDFHYTAEHDYRIYHKLHELKSIYEKAAKTTRDRELRLHYQYFVMAIDRALKVD